jgi:hypothetical protein
MNGGGNEKLGPHHPQSDSPHPGGRRILCDTRRTTLEREVLQMPLARSREDEGRIHPGLTGWVGDAFKLPA